LDHELTSVIEFFVVAADRGQPSRSATARVKIMVLNIDDELPHFTNSFYSFLVLENEPAGTEVGWVSAIDRDGSPFNHFIYSLESPISNVFSVEPSTGLMTTRIILDREQQEMYQVIALETRFLVC
jgi:Cadherin domain